MDVFSMYEMRTEIMKGKRNTEVGQGVIWDIQRYLGLCLTFFFFNTNDYLTLPNISSLPFLLLPTFACAQTLRLKFLTIILQDSNKIGCILDNVTISD